MSEYNDEKIRCHRCHVETNHVPPELPQEWDGFCPKCAMHLAYKENILPKGDMDLVVPQVINQFATKLAEILGVEVKVETSSNFVPVSEDDGGVTFITRQCLN